MRQTRKPAEAATFCGQIINGSINNVADATDVSTSCHKTVQRQRSVSNLTADEALDYIDADAEKAGMPLNADDAYYRAQFEISAEHWYPPQPLQQRMQVAPFRYDLLPRVLQGYVSDIATHLQCPADFVAIPLLIALSSLCDRVAKVQVAPRWTTSLNLWGAIVGRPGTLKSPASNAGLKFIHELQTKADEEFKQHKKTDEKQHEVRYVVNDATQPALLNVLADNKSVLYADDELVALFQACDRTNENTYRAFLLKCADGSQGHRIDRVTRDAARAKTVSVSIFGTIQPSKLAKYRNEAVNHGEGDDGLMQRFSLLVEPDFPKDFHFIEDEEDEIAEQAVRDVFNQIAAQEKDEKRIMRLSYDAKQIIKQWRIELETEIRSHTLNEALESQVSKYRKLVPALAAIFALVESPACEQIEFDHVERAVAFAKYVRSHAERIYSEYAEQTPELMAAQNLLDHLENGDIDLHHGVLNVRFVSRKQWSLLKNPAAVRRACEYLIDAGHLRTAEFEQSSNAHKYIVHPRLRYKYYLKHEQQPKH